MTHPLICAYESDASRSGSSNPTMDYTDAETLDRLVPHQLGGVSVAIGARVAMANCRKWRIG